MTDDRKPMPVDGDGSERNPPDDIGELASRRDAQSAGGLPNVGESGGGAYPNPHSGKDGEDGDYEGGQSGGRGYYGGGDQLGDKVIDGNDNAGSRDE